jgi:hypothetical protein
MVEDSGQLVLHGAGIERKVRLSILGPEPQHFILPGHDDLRRNGTHCQPAEVGDQFCPDDKELFCCGLRGLFPWNHYRISPMLYQAFSIFLYV